MKNATEAIITLLHRQYIEYPEGDLNHTSPPQLLGDMMGRTKTFTLRMNADERQMLESLARRLERSQSDVVRWLLREATRRPKHGAGVTQQVQRRGPVHDPSATT